jgi:hypothetical protein
MQPFWITLEVPREKGPTPLRLGVGVTATSEADARHLFTAAFGSEYRIASMKPLEDVATLEQDHVVPNMGNIFRRGIWFPQGYEQAIEETPWKS